MPSNEMEEFVIELLKSRLPAWYHYHNAEHTLYVMNKVVEIGQQEHCTPQEIGLLRAAALWHDAGHIHQYEGHEEESCLLAQRYMPAYTYTADDIEKVCGMVRATRTPQTPIGKLQEIMADADLEYLGTDTVDQKSYQLFLELQYLDPTMTKNSWAQREISFLQDHHFFTKYCIENKEPRKQEYLSRLLRNVNGL